MVRVRPPSLGVTTPESWAMVRVRKAPLQRPVRHEDSY
jgi:hypothetical protein